MKKYLVVLPKNWIHKNVEWQVVITFDSSFSTFDFVD